MIKQPLFKSHAEQQAALGSAAILDPAKFPRRAALERARSRQPRASKPGTLLSRQRAERENMAPTVRKMAKTMTGTEVGIALKKSRPWCERIAEDNGFKYKKRDMKKRRTLADVVDEFERGISDGKDQH